MKNCAQASAKGGIIKKFEFRQLIFDLSKQQLWKVGRTVGIESCYFRTDGSRYELIKHIYVRFRIQKEAVMNFESFKLNYIFPITWNLTLKIMIIQSLLRISSHIDHGALI